MNPKGWSEDSLGRFLSESRIVGSTGATARKLTVKLYGKGVIEKRDDRGIGSDSTRYYRRRAGQFIYSKLDFLNGAFGVIPPALDGRETTLDLPAFDVDGHIDVRWLVAFVSRPEFYKGFLGAAKGSRKARRVNQDELLATRIYFPPLGEQRRIADILSSVDDAIETTQRVINELHVVKKAMTAELLTRGRPGRHTNFKRTEIGEIPEEWMLCSVGDLCNFTGGNGFRPGDWASTGLPIIRIQNLNGSMDFNYYAEDPDPAWLVEPGDLLFAWAGTRGASFGPCMWPGPRGVLNQHIHRIIPNNLVRKRFFFYVLRLLTEAVEKKAHGFKTTLVHLRKGELTKWPVAVPSIPEQDEIAAVLGGIEDRVAREKRGSTAFWP